MVGETGEEVRRREREDEESYSGVRDEEVKMERRTVLEDFEGDGVLHTPAISTYKTKHPKG